MTYRMLHPHRRIYIFSDESGDSQFGTTGASRHFILVTITSLNCDFGHRLLDLRRELAWRGLGLNEEWHATENPDKIRGSVFDALSKCDFIADATIFEKTKVPEYYRTPPERFYEFAWYWHFSEIAKQTVDPGDELFVVSASIGTKKTRKLFHLAVGNAVGPHIPGVMFRTAHWRDDSDPCLIAADYVAWAIYRRNELLMPHYYNTIKDRIRSEVRFFDRETKRGRG